MNEVIAFDHIHLISRDPKAAAGWYQEIFGGDIAAVQENLRGAPQIDVRVGGVTIVIRGQRPGEEPVKTKPMQSFDGYSSHDGWGTDHFGSTYRGDLMAFCGEFKNKGARAYHRRATGHTGQDHHAHEERDDPLCEPVG